MKQCKKANFLLVNYYFQQVKDCSKNHFDQKQVIDALSSAFQ